MAQDLVQRLETEIDRCGLKAVIEALGIVCEEKAEHIMVNWQDQITAASWKRAVHTVNSIVSKIEV